MIQSFNNKTYVMLDKEKEQSLHKDAFMDTYKLIKEFSNQSSEIYQHINKNKPKSIENLFVHQVLCSPPGHGKTTSLEYHVKMEAIQTETRKNPYLLVFNNKDTMNSFYESVIEFTNKYQIKNAIVAIDEHNIEQFKDLLSYYQIVCIVHQRLRDLATGFGDAYLFLKYRQEQSYWGTKPDNLKKSLVQRTVIIDEMPIFFDSVIFDIGKDNNVLDWYDSFANATSDDVLSAREKNNGRLYINSLINAELNNIGNTTLKLNRSIASTQKEVELLHILNVLNKNVADNASINRYRRFMRLLDENAVGAINNISKKNILCSDFIDYKQFGNILILDGTAEETSTIYKHAGFTIKNVTNYHRYTDRLRFFINKINTSSYKREDPKSEIREQISDDIIEKRNKGIDILPIPSKNDINSYITLGAITPQQQQQFFMDRQHDDDFLPINIHNLTGKNDLSKYNHIALLNLPIMKPDEYRLKAIAIYGTDIDLRLVKELEDRKEQKLHKGKWFVDQRLQTLFEEQQKAELSQIIHRSSIRNINADEKVVIHMYHNKEQVIDLLKEIFQISDKNFIVVDIQKKNNLKVKCRKFAEQIHNNLKNSPNQEFTAFKAGGGRSFQKWLNDNWNEHKEIIRVIFREFKIAIKVKGKGNYKYFTYVDNGIFEECMDDETLEELFA